MSEFSKIPISIAVCDDEPNDLAEMETMTSKLLEAEGISCDVSKFGDAGSLLSSVEGGEAFDILILDVMMENLNGIELAATLRGQGSDTAIVFASTNREMALLGYEVSAVRYLAKPIQREKLREALLYCYRTYLAQKEILLPTAEGQRRISVSDLIYMEPWDRGTRLVLTDGECKTSAKISELERRLPKEKFAFCHRTLLVNLAFIQSIRYCELTLKNGQVLPISKYRQAQIKERFMHYLRDGGM